MKRTDTTTLHDTEVRWKPAALGVVVCAHTLGAWLFVLASRGVPGASSFALLLPYLLLTASNLVCLSTSGPSVGEIPIALFALEPALLAYVLAPVPHGFAWWICLVLCIALACMTAFFVFWFTRIAGAITSENEVSRDAVLIVLGGLVRNGVPIRTVQERLRTAARLWRASRTRTIVLSGGRTPDGTTTEAEAMAAWLMRVERVPAEALLLETRALNTKQNLAFSREVIEAAGLGDRQLCVVSSDYHLYRARALGRRLGMELAGVPAPVSWRSRPQQWCREVLTLVVNRVR